MIQVLGTPRRLCDGWSRRELLRVGGLSLLGGPTLPGLLRAESKPLRATGQRPRAARNIILLYLLGGAATQDMWDLKPDAPAEIRGEFRPVATSVPGVRIAEHLPRMARLMHHAALVRSVNHRAGCHNCLPSYTGFAQPMPDQHPRETDPPSMGSVCEFLRQQGLAPSAGNLPAYAYLPTWLGWGQAFRRAGPYGGFLGKRCDALTTECKPYHDPGLTPRPGHPTVVRGMPFLADGSLPTDLTLDRLDRRRSLLQQVDDQLGRIERQPALVHYDRSQMRAFDLLTSSKVRGAFEVGDEDPRLVDRYGRTLFGHSTLIARRLIEAGVRFVNVTWDLFWDRVQVDYDAWDTHNRNFAILKENKLPHFDQTYSALLEDLDNRGLLDETLVVVMSEMGRTPRINGNAGRDHWTYCYSVLLAGGGIQGGSVYGASDAHAAYVKDLPVSPADICATIYRCLGIDPEMTVPDRTGRPFPIAQGGQAIEAILRA